MKNASEAKLKTSIQRAFERASGHDHAEPYSRELYPPPHTHTFLSTAALGSALADGPTQVPLQIHSIHCTVIIPIFSIDAPTPRVVRLPVVSSYQRLVAAAHLTRLTLRTPEEPS